MNRKLKIFKERTTKITSISLLNLSERKEFMNFDRFRRYYNGMIKKAGKRVAHFNISKKTREFLSFISGRLEKLKNIENSILPKTTTNSVGRPKNKNIDTNNLIYHNLLDDLLLQNYEKFYLENSVLKKKNPYANTGRRLNYIFIDWIKDRYSNDYPKRDLLLQKINYINENEEIAQYILYLLINNNITQVELNSLLLKSHLNVSRETVRVIAEKNFSNEDYKKKFSRGDGWKKFNLTNSKKLIFSSLLNKELLTFFKQYYHDTGNYANFGKKITNNFISWVKLSDINASKKKEFFILVENINQNKEIVNYIIYHVKKYISSNAPNMLPLSFFSKKLNPLFLEISDISIGRIIKNNIFKNDDEGFKKMFPAGGREENKVINLNNLNFDDLLDSSLNIKFKNYKLLFSTSNNPIYANHGTKITDDFIQWINLNEQDFAKKELLILCKKINENEEILAYIIHLSLNTNYNLSEIAREIKLIGLSGQHQTVASIVKKYIFNFDDIKYKERFHSQDIVSQNGTSTHLCVNSLIALFFNTDTDCIYKYYSEIKIFPPSDKKADGFFLNIKAQRFFYVRLTEFEDSERLRKTLNIEVALFKKLIGVQIEFTSDLSDENILNKCMKYQNELILLIIVGTHWRHKNIDRQIIPNYSEILYPDNVLVISPRLFKKLLNFNSNFIQEFDKIIEYSKNYDIVSLDQYYDNIYNKITLYSTNDFIKDVSKQFFSKYFFDPEKELNNLEISTIFSSFISYCKNNSTSLDTKNITRGSFIGSYYIFDTANLKQFNYQLNVAYNLLNLGKLLEDYIGKGKIFFKKTTYPDSTGRLKKTKRGILINSSFLDNYQEDLV